MTGTWSTVYEALGREYDEQQNLHKGTEVRIPYSFGVEDTCRDAWLRRCAAREIAAKYPDLLVTILSDRPSPGAFWPFRKVRTMFIISGFPADIMDYLDKVNEQVKSERAH